jgi:murein DD-endopeptidase MepM/ murein hydrolase activator NlpD
MLSLNSPARRWRNPRPWRLLAIAALVLGACVIAAVPAAEAESVEERLQDKKQALREIESQAGTLSTELESNQAQLEGLRARVADLRNREAVVQAELDSAEAELRMAVEQLEVIRERLRRSVALLRDRLVQIFKAGDPEVLSILLEADGFDDLATRYQYLGAIEQDEEGIVDQVRELREDTRLTVDGIRETRDTIVARKAELEGLRVSLEGRQADLAAALATQRRQLDRISSQEVHLERGVAKLEDEIQEQLEAAQAAAEAEAPAPVVSGPVQGESSSGFIWPVEGPLTSPFGMRWGRLHAGIDIGAPGGTPIKAAAAGTIALAAPYGGYGNYTCLEHGDGLSTCYAHQSAFEVTAGEVEQGQVIGYVGNTGASFGDHLHFEVRVNGEPVDPLGYL